MARTSQQRSCGEDIAECLQWHAHACLRQGADCSLLIFRPLEHVSRAAVRSSATTRDQLPALAERIRSRIRRTDIIEVYDQKAVVVLLPSAGREGARAAFHRLCELLSGAPLPGERTHVIVVGHATRTTEPGGDDAIGDVIRDAWEPRALVSVALPSAAALPDACAGDTATRPVRLARSEPAISPHPSRAPAHSSRRAHLRLVGYDQRSSPADEDLWARARALGVPCVQIPTRLPLSCRSVIGSTLARELSAVPIGRSRNMLTVAMHNPCDAAAVLRLRAVTGLGIFPVLAAPDQLERALRQIAHA